MSPEPQSGAIVPSDGVPMQFRDGSQAMVPKEKVTDAMYDGGELLHPMKFPDNSRAMVPHSKLAGAFKDGGQRLDTRPLTAPTWKDYVGMTFGAATDPQVGAETATPSLAPDVTKGLDEATSGHPVKGATRVAGAVVEAAGPALLMPETGGTMQAADAAAAEAPSLRALWKIAKDTEQASEVSGAETMKVGWEKFSQMAKQGASDASGAKAAAYHGAAALAKAYSKYEGAWAWLGKTIPGAPIGIKIALALKIGKDGYDWLTEGDENK